MDQRTERPWVATVSKRHEEPEWGFLVWDLLSGLPVRYKGGTEELEVEPELLG